MDKIYQLTTGHPALIQTICYELVRIANMAARKNMTMDDLETITEEQILKRDNSMINIFWTQFCMPLFQ
ncbi:hypothetical protein [Candidatus Albibeggiatoa sp. nov. BB20]|uniref:hypothetical protein n=1 Tax=Candidatus Albibeggiatoa sp. nov. BB20 TaxID=3162723 RepID=UPI003365708C